MPEHSVAELKETLAHIEAARATAEEDFKAVGVPEDTIAAAIEELDTVIAHIRALLPEQSGPPEERMITLPHEVWEAARHYAACKGWSVDQWICELIRRYLRGEMRQAQSEAAG